MAQAASSKKPAKRARENVSAPSHPRAAPHSASTSAPDSSPTSSRQKGRKTPSREKTPVALPTDAEATPKASALSLPLASDHDSTTSSRASSPTKMAAFTGAGGGIKQLFINIEDIPPETEVRGSSNKSHPLQSVRDLLAQLEDYNAGVGVVPVSMKQHFRSQDRSFRLEHVFDTTDARERLGAVPPTQVLDDIVNQTKECMQEQEHEAAWNRKVQWPVAQIALDTSCQRDNVLLKNITVAKIQPIALVPNFSGSGTPRLQSKMVDFAYVLRDTPAINTAYDNLELELGQPMRSFNHTCHSTIIRRPIAISIETKPDTVSGEGAWMQLAIWASAHFNKLAELVEDAGTNVVLPPILLVRVHGEKWTFCAATREKDGLILWRPLEDISTTTKLGVCKVLASLHLVLKWAGETYRLWFESGALPLTSEQRELVMRQRDEAGDMEADRDAEHTADGNIPKS